MADLRPGPASDYPDKIVRPRETCQQVSTPEPGGPVRRALSFSCVTRVTDVGLGRGDGATPGVSVRLPDHG
jgi:hypothetical protein